MHINYTEGCICTSLTIDEIETIDIEISELKKIVKKLLNYERNNKSFLMKDIIMDLIEYSDNNIYVELDNSQINGRVIIYQTKVNNNTYKKVDLFYNDLILVNDNIWEEKVISDEIFNDIICMVDMVNDISIFQSIIINIVENNGKYKCSDKPCDCCGDYVRTYDLNI